MEYLFSDYDLHAVQENQRAAMVAEINNSPGAVADGRTPDEIAAEFVHRFRLDTPDGAISMDVEEVQVDVSGDRQRAIFDWSRPFYIPGFRVTQTSAALQEQLDPLLMRYSAARKQSARRKFIFRQCHPGAVLARKSAQ